MRFVSAVSLVAIAFVALGCGPTVDPPRPVDAGALPADAGSAPEDAGAAADTGMEADSGIEVDAGPAGPVECGGPIEAPCPEGSTCVKNDGLCDGRPNGQFPTGTCQPVLAECPDAAEEDAVCGCSGATYASRCHAQLHGEDVAEPGVCRDQSGLNRCTVSADCGRDEFYCATPLGHCNAVAFCLPNPNMCTQEESPDRGSPVCDCNGNEHHNLCNARLAGESIRNVGPCR